MHDTSLTGGTGPTEAEETRLLDGARVVRAALTDALAFRPGDQIGRYVILRELGSGGMSVVYVAYDPQLDRQIALKLVRPGGATSASDSARRLHREAQALARLSHPNVVHVYDVGTFENNVYIAMELVAGKTLRQWLLEEQRPWQDVLAVVTEAGEGLAAAHDAGLVHFDFKPGNVLISELGRVHVVDFGLAREPRVRGPASIDEEFTAEPGPTGRLGEPLTEHGAVLGTPGYISPEQLAGKQADARADQFSFCVTLWQGIYGERPFVGRNRAALQKAVMRGRLREPPAGHAVPAWVLAVLTRGLAVKPEDRYPSLRELLTELRRRPASRRRRTIWVLGIGAVLGLGALAYRGAQGRGQIDCAPGSERLAAQWVGDAQRDAEAAFESTGVPYAAQAWVRTAAELDAYVEAWRQMHVDACEATHVRGDQSASLLDRRMACLGHAELEFVALRDLFRDADAELVRNAVRAAQSLAPVSACAEAAALQPAELPEDPVARDRVVALEAEVARTEALSFAGRYDEAIRVGSRVLARAQDLGHGPSIWSVSNVLGTAHNAVGASDRAVIAHTTALTVAEEGGLDFLRAVSLSELSYVYGNLIGDVDRARWFARSAHAVLDRLGGNKRRRAELLSNEAIVVTLSGDIEEALELSRRAVDLRREAGLDEDTNFAALLGNLGGALYSAGRYEEALEQYEAAYRIRLAQLGESHPTLAVSMENIGNSMQALERYEEALEYHQAALEMSRTAGLSGAKLGLQLNNVAVALFGMERYAAAREAYHSAIAAYESGAVKHPAHAVALCNLGELEVRTGQFDQARHRYEQGLALLAEVVPPEHPWLTLGLTGLGVVLIHDGQLQRARKLLERSKAIHDETPTDPLAAAETQLHLGRVLWDLEPARRAEARAHVERAHEGLAALSKRGRVPLELAQRWLREHAP